MLLTPGLIDKPGLLCRLHSLASPRRTQTILPFQLVRCIYPSGPCCILRAPEEMHGVIDYLCNVLLDLLPGQGFYNGIPLNQHLLYNASQAVGMYEQNATYTVRHMPIALE